jgi:hypothetical protein
MVPEQKPSIFYFKGASLSLRLLALAAIVSFAASAHATNIVADPGFESAGGGNIYYAGQSIDGGSWNVTAGSVYIDTGDPYVFAGSNALNLTGANPYVPDSVSQTLTTIVGKIYDVSFWADADSSNVFSLTENGTAVTGAPTSIVDNGFPNPTSNSSLFVDYLGIFTATSTTTVLKFTDTADPPIDSALGSVMIDNVSVQPTPEPSSIALMLTGLLGLGFVLARKRLAGSLSAL